MINVEKLDGVSRSRNILKQITASFVFKALAIILNLLVVPISLNYLGVEVYGLWVTILSIVTWLSLSDLGVGNGLRNKLSESLSKGEMRISSEYISTAYFTLVKFCFPILLVVGVISYHLDWNVVFNSIAITNAEIRTSLIITLIGIFFTLTLGIVNQVVSALQKSSWTSTISILANGFLIIILLVHQHIGTPSLISFSVTYSCCQLVSIVIFSTFIFTRFPDLTPKLRLYRRNKVKDIWRLGMSFFVIQIAVVIIFNTDNILVAQMFSAEEVTKYNLLYRLFNYVVLFSGLIIAPFWSAYTEAYTKKDFVWIMQQVKRLNLLMLPVSLLVIAMSLVTEQLIDLWTGAHLEYDLLFVCLMALYAIIAVWNNIYSFLLNGLGRTKEQLITAAIGAILNIPLSIFFASYLKMGPSGVMLSTIVCLIFFSFIGPLVAYKEFKLWIAR